MNTTFTWAGRVAGGLLAAAAAAIIAMPVAGAACNQTVGQFHRLLPEAASRRPATPAGQSQAEGGGPDVIGYLNRHPDVRQHLIDLSQQCTLVVNPRRR